MPDRGVAFDSVALTTTRGGFLARAGRLLALVAGVAGVAGKRAGDADAFHFCGHIYTTDSCPHPTGLPRVDAHGYPLRARDGRPVDNLGRLVDRSGFPVDEQGRRLAAPDGQPLPPAPRTRICLDQVRRRFGLRTYVDGSWYRCCGGRVRKLIDCCTYGRRRINGDAGLPGYCYRGRRVFCVIYYDTNVRC
jgi:hypothetical protein